MKDEVEKLIAVDISLIIDEDVQLLVNGVPVFTITQEQRVYRAVVSNPKAPDKLLALIQTAQVEAVRAARIDELSKAIQVVYNHSSDVSVTELTKTLIDRLANLKGRKK